MRIRHQISFATGLRGVEGWSAVHEILQTAGCADMSQNDVESILAGYFMADFDEGDPRLQKLRSVLENNAYRWSEQREYMYDNAELRAAPLLVFRVTTAEKDIGRYVREQFDFSIGCPICRTGAKQVGPLRVKAAALPKRSLICQTIACDYLVTEPLKQGLDRTQLSGLELMQAVSRKGERLAWWQVVPRFELPPMAAETRGILRGLPRDGCAGCRRDNWFQTSEEPTQIVYRRSQLGGRDLPDVAYTYECFGISALDINGYLARGLTLVSPKVLEIFRDLKIKDVHFDPVHIIED